MSKTGLQSSAHVETS